MTVASTLRRHWPEYAIEAWALGTFMLSAGFFTALVERPEFGVREAIASDFLRRCLIGLAMGATAVGLIYSRWGRRSGAHMNPAVTLTFLWLGRIARVDAAFYIAAQFAGGLLGALTALAVLGERFADAPVGYVATLPGPQGPLVAFVSEAAISCGLMAVVLVFSSNVRLMAFTGLAAGALVACYISFEAPLSGMSMNPARSFASAAPSGHFESLWLYFAAPPLGMGLAALVSRRFAAAGCAKLHHARDTPCIHCGYTPNHGEHPNADSIVPNAHL